MSWGFLGKVGGALKDAATGVGHTLGTVASNPFVEGALGLTLGPEAAAAAGGLGHLLAPGGNIGSGITGALTGGAAGAAGSAIGSGLSGIASGGLAGIGKNALNIGKGGAALGAAASSPAVAQSVASGSAPPGDQNILQKILGSSVGGVPTPIAGLAGLQGINAAQLGAKANDFSNKAWDYASGSYDTRAPLRAAGQAQLLNPTPRDTSDLTSIRARITPGLAGLPQPQPQNQPQNHGPLRLG